MCIRNSTLLLLRFNASIQLFHIFLIALSQVPPKDMFTLQSLTVFIIIHVFYYPASNGLNSYYDKDIGPINGLSTPPQPKQQLLWVSIGFKIIAIIWSYFVNLSFMCVVTLNMFLSVCYSHPKIRLKARPCLSCFMLGFCYYYLGIVGMALGISGIEHIFKVTRIHLVGIEGLIIGFFIVPISQIFQIQSDQEERGEETFALWLGGVKGSIIFSAVLFMIHQIGAGLLLIFFYPIDSMIPLMIGYIICQLPSIPFVLLWFLKYIRDRENAIKQETLCWSLLSPLAFSMSCFLLGLVGYTYYFELELPSFPVWQL